MSWWLHRRRRNIWNQRIQNDNSDDDDDETATATKMINEKCVRRKLITDWNASTELVFLNLLCQHREILSKSVDDHQEPTPMIITPNQFQYYTRILCYVVDVLPRLMYIK